MTLRPFNIQIPDERLELLDQRLRSAVWADEAGEARAWEYGVPGTYLRELVEYWLDRYDWHGSKRPR
jgi:epoxide hydrolase